MGELEGQYKSDTSLPPVQGVPFPGTTCLTEVSHPASTMHLPCSGLTAPSRCSHFSWKSAAGSAGGGEKESGGSIPAPPSLCLFPQGLMFINRLQSICLFGQSIILVGAPYRRGHLPSGYTLKKMSLRPSATGNCLWEAWGLGILPFLPLVTAYQSSGRGGLDSVFDSIIRRLWKLESVA